MTAIIAAQTSVAAAEPGIHAPAVTRVWHNSAGEVYAVNVEPAAGEGYTAALARGQVSWATPDVWAYPQRFGLTRYTCPGHGGHVCYYGMCDEIRVADLAWLRAAAAEADSAE